MKSTPAQKRHRAMLKARRERLDDLRFMLTTGVSNEIEAAHRLGVTPSALDWWCYRTGNRDIWNRLIAYRAIQRDDWKGDRSLLRPRKDAA